jgi:HPt (histidine-containing phosphotransfer) domain-containing protein
LSSVAFDPGTAANWGNPAKFRSFLNRFSTEYSGFLDRVQGLEPADLAREVHQLRGAAAVLGLTDVARWTTEVEVTLRAGADPRDALEALRDALNTVVASIRNFQAGRPGRGWKPLRLSQAPRNDCFPVSQFLSSSSKEIYKFARVHQ